MPSEESPKVKGCMRGLLNGVLCGYDVDDLFAFETVKLVRVRDFKLGMLYYAFQLTIFLYVIVYGVILRRGYLATEQIQAGSVTLNSQVPGGSAALPADQLSYCCEGAACPADPSDTSARECLYWDQYLAEYPVGKDYSIVVTSRVTHSKDVANSPNCTIFHWAQDCDWISTIPETDYYIANSERFSIRVRHGVRGQIIPRSGTNTGNHAMKGRLVNTDGGDTLRSWPSSTPFAGVVPQDDTRSGDIMTVEEILKATGINIGDNGIGADTLRYDGVNVVVYITYEMDGDEDLKYKYEPRALYASEYKVEQAIYDDASTGSTREIYNRHGVRFIFVQTGELGRFDFLVLMTTLVTGLALLAVATTITNQIMLRAMSMRAVYRARKYLVTEDFSVWRDMDDAQREAYITQAKDGMYHELTTTKNINGDTHRVTAEPDIGSIHLQSDTAETLLTSSEA